MKHSQKGEFYGQTNTTIHLDGITLTDTVYTHDKVDWHYHEHAYFTFILQGNVLEGNKKEIYTCSPGSLLFHNWQEPHYNIKPGAFTRGFHIEIEKDWVENLGLTIDQLQGSINITDPDVKFLFYKLFRETKTGDPCSPLSIPALLLQTFSLLLHNNPPATSKKPAWVYTIKEMLNDRVADKPTLEQLSTTLGIHPVHLSRDFPRYFHCGLGEYMRKLKVEKALSLIADKQHTLASIAYECGFADQSHFTRLFKELNGISPSHYRKILLGRC